jgi:type I restriction enzyme S subunit
MNFFFDHFEILSDAPNGIKKLRELILQLAVMGKLVPQDPDDEPASVLLEKIKGEKERLIKEGKIKKQNPLPPIKDDEKPFELPNGWEWSYLDECSLIIMGQSPESKYYNNTMNGLPFYQGKADFGELFPTPRIWCSNLQKIAYENDILISVRAPVGPTNICKEKSCIGRGLSSISTLNIYEHFYLLYSIRSFEKKISAMGVGSTFTAISYSHLKYILIPLPPLNEQKRIVAKVDRLMAFCDELEKKKEKRESRRISLNNACLDKLLSSREPEEFQEHWQRIVDHFDILYHHPGNVAKLKQAILQLAVMGKLVPQDPDDEPAEVLFEKIKQEKEQLIKEGKIKRQKPLPPITDDEKPFELPKSWEWVKLAQISKIIHYGYTASADNTITNVRLLRITDIQNDKVNWESVPGCKISDSNLKSYELKNGDLLIARTGGTIGKTYLVQNLSECAVFASYLIRAVPYPLVYQKFLKCFTGSFLYWDQLYSKCSGTGQPNVNGRSLSDLFIPMPPFNEQKRIVAKVEQLLSLCDRLAERLQEADSKRDKLFQAVVNQVLE